MLIAAALVAAVCVLAAVAWWWWRDPYRLIRLEYARQRRALGLARRSVDAGGHRWVYADNAGPSTDAPVLVMLHGYTGSKENWYPVARRLRARYRMLMPDLPGWGESERVADADYGYAAQADRVAAFIIAACGDAPIVLLGHSMGGGIAAVVAARHPRRVARIALLDAAGVRFADNAFGQAVLDGANPFAVEDTASLERYLGTVFFQAHARPPMPWPAGPSLVAQRRRDAGFEQSVLDRIGRGPEQFLPGALAADIRQPALLVWGAHDRVIDPSAMELYAAHMPQARTLLLERSGHMTLMEQPDDVADAVVALIESGETQ